MWQDTVVGWLINNHNHRLMVVRYEDLVTGTHPEVMMMLDFLRFPYSLSTVARRLRRNYDEFHRSQSNTSPHDHFTAEQISFVDTVIKNTVSILRSHRLLDMCNITDYLHHT